MAQISQVGGGFARSLTIGPELKLMVVGLHIAVGLEVQHKVMADQVNHSVEGEPSYRQRNRLLSLDFPFAHRLVNLALVESLDQIKCFLNVLCRQWMSMGFPVVWNIQPQF